MNQPVKPPDPKKPKSKSNQPNSSAWTAPLPDAPPTKPAVKPDPFWRPKSRKYR